MTLHLAVSREYYKINWQSQMENGFGTQNERLSLFLLSLFIYLITIPSGQSLNK